MELSNTTYRMSTDTIDWINRWDMRVLTIGEIDPSERKIGDERSITEEKR